MESGQQEHWHVAVEPTSEKRKAAGARRAAVALDRTRDWVERRVLEPRRRGEPIAIGGQTFGWDEIGRLRIGVSEEPAVAVVQRLREQDSTSSVVALGGPTYEERVPYAVRDVTDELIEGPPGSLALGPERSPGEPQSDPRAVMVVHGRNGAARRAMFDFLRALKLEPLEWGALVAGTGKGTPYVGEVLEHAFQRARAVLVLFTGDDEARLCEPLRRTDDPDYERRLTPQARPNVLFEAGLAFGVHPERTILVELGTLRPFSDIVGRHVIRLDGTEQPLREIARRLETAKCRVDTAGDDWLWPGRFPAIAEQPPDHSADEVSGLRTSELEAIHDILDELESIRLRVERVLREDWYPWNFTLPAQEYHDHKSALPSHVRERVGAAYVRADDLIDDLGRRDEDGSRVQGPDNLDGLLDLVRGAQDALREERDSL